MSNPNFMPLHGAVLISNPRTKHMAYNNPNYYRRLNKAERSGESQEKAAARSALRAQFRSRFGERWYQDGAARAEYDAAAEGQGISAKKMLEYVTSGRAPATSRSTRDSRRRAKAASAKAKGYRTYGKTKATAFRWGKKRAYEVRTARKDWNKQATAPDGRRFTPKAGDEYVVVVASVPNQRTYNAGRLGRKAQLAYWQGPAAIANPGSLSVGSRDIWGEFAGDAHTYKTGKPKGSGTLIQHGFSPSQLPNAPLIYTRSERSAKAKKAAATRKRKGIEPFGGRGAEYRALGKQVSTLMKQGMSNAEARAAVGLAPKGSKNNPLYRGRRYARRNQPGAKAKYRMKHHKAIKKAKIKSAQAQDNWGALALDNYGALALDNYGALALDNRGLPFTRQAADIGKLIGVGFIGAIGHAFVADQVEELLPSIPGGEMLLDVSVPDAVPLIGGMELDNTISGAIAGGLVIALSQIIGRQLRQPMISSYGSALGTGIILVGPALDFAASSDDEGDEEEIAAENWGALALDNYGALSLENEGTFGDGMAYQIGAIVEEDAAGTEYGQASLGDAYYSGADFDLGEGQALVNGRRFWNRRYGHAPRRIGRMGGVRGSASHLASRPGHRWGWLIKMIGWKNVQSLAAMPPVQRVSTIKRLRANALDTFQKLQAEQVQVTAAAAPELVPVSSEGADGTAGAFGAYGATLVGGAGL